jgi:hypothetical protein
MGALRLLPGGLALVGWAAANGRPQPSSAIAWAWVAAFALVDGAMFQVRAGGWIEASACRDDAHRSPPRYQCAAHFRPGSCRHFPLCLLHGRMCSRGPT